MLTSTPQPWGSRAYLEPIENKIHDIFQHAIAKRCRNLFIRFDVNFPDDSIDYQETYLFSEFMRVFIQDLNRKNFGDAYYLAVRERVANAAPPLLGSVQHGPHEHPTGMPSPLTPSAAVQHGLHDYANRVKHGHYHVFILLNGKYTQNIYGHMSRAEEIWARTLNRFTTYTGDGSGLINYLTPAEGNGIMLRTDDPDFHAKVLQCIEQSMYLAKEATKESFGKFHHTWASSKGIPPR